MIVLFMLKNKVQKAIFDSFSDEIKRDLVNKSMSKLVQEPDYYVLCESAEKHYSVDLGLQSIPDLIAYAISDLCAIALNQVLFETNNDRFEEFYSSDTKLLVKSMSVQ